MSLTVSEISQSSHHAIVSAPQHLPHVLVPITCPLLSLQFSTQRRAAWTPHAGACWTLPDNPLLLLLTSSPVCQVCKTGGSWPTSSNLHIRFTQQVH
jgi:hypothetical protein